MSVSRIARCIDCGPCHVSAGFLGQLGPFVGHLGPFVGHRGPSWALVGHLGVPRTLLKGEKGAATCINFSLRVTNAGFLTIRSPHRGTTPALGMNPAERRGPAVGRRIGESDGAAAAPATGTARRGTGAPRTGSAGDAAADRPRERGASGAAAAVRAVPRGGTAGDRGAGLGRGRRGGTGVGGGAGAETGSETCREGGSAEELVAFDPGLAARRRTRC